MRTAIARNLRSGTIEICQCHRLAHIISHNAVQLLLFDLQSFLRLHRQGLQGKTLTTICLRASRQIIFNGRILFALFNLFPDG